MIITFYTPTLKLTGGNLVMFKYAKYLASQGIEVYVIAPDFDKKDYIENGVHIKTFKKFPNKYFEHIFFQLIYLKNFYNLTPKSDIIIPIFFPLVIHALFCKKEKKCKKMIPLFQDYKDMFWFGWYIYFILGLKCITQNIDNFIAVSDPVAQEIKKYTGREATIIKNGIDNENFYPRDLPKENYILFVGSSLKAKGLKNFLKAFDIVKKKFPHLKAKIVSRNNINNPNIEVVNIGNDRNKLGEIYSKALIYVSQSLGDSFGLPPLEAMACGTAVVLTDTVGAKEYAVNYENSLIVPIKSIDLTVKAITEILNNVSLRNKLAQNGIVTAQKYKWAKSCSQFMELMEREIKCC